MIKLLLSAAAAGALSAMVAWGTCPQGCVEFTYSDGSAPQYLGTSNSPTKFAAAVRLTNAKFVGARVVGCRVDNLKGGGAGQTGFRMWVDTQPNHSPATAVTDITPVDGTIEAIFDEPFTIGADGAAVGFNYEVTGEEGYFSVPYTTPKGVANSCLVTANGADYFQDYSSLGALPIVVYLDQMTQDDDCVSIEALLGRKDPAVALVDCPFSLDFTVGNGGSNQVTSLGYSYSLEGGETRHGTVDLSASPLLPGVGNTATVRLPFEAFHQVARGMMTVTLDQVNGNDNTCPDPSMTFLLKVKDPGLGFNPSEVDQFTYVEDGAAIQPIGVKDKVTYDVAIHLANAAYAGFQVVGAKVDNLLADNMKGYRLWTSSALSDTPDGDVVVTDYPQDGEIYAAFPSAPTLGTDGLYVGYSMEVAALTTATETPIPYAAGKKEDTLWLRYANGGWTDYGAMYGPATITVYLEGSMLRDAASLGAMTTTAITSAGQPLTVRLQVVNAGSTPIASLDYTLDVDGAAEPTAQHVDLSAAPIAETPGSTGTIDVQLPAQQAGGMYPFTVTVDRVNGNANYADGAAGSFRYCVPLYTVARQPLYEEVTGTWQGWCPEGDIARRELHQRMPALPIVAYHNQDAMTMTDSYPFKVSAIPGASVDRGSSYLDPFYGTGWDDLDIAKDIEAAAKKASPASISVSAAWADGDPYTLRATSKVRFGQADNGQYTVAYVVTRSGITGDDTDKLWQQLNSFAGQGYPGLLAELSDLPKVLTGWVFNDVAVNVDHYRGAQGSIPADFQLDQDITHVQDFDMHSAMSLKGYEMLTARTGLRVVAVLLDPKGAVANSAVTDVPEYSSAVDAPGAEALSEASVTYYDLQGRRVDAPAACGGVYVRVATMQDGSVRTSKVLRTTQR